MKEAPTPILSSGRRGLIRLSGDDAVSWLQNLVTSDVEGQPDMSAGASALLSPQGKVLFSFLVLKNSDGSLTLDADEASADALAKRLAFYRLRARVDLAPPEFTEAFTVEGETSDGWRDLRFRSAAMRIFGSGDRADDDDASLRIRDGVAEAGLDFMLGEPFPHDINLDQTGGVGFRKGCFVGQEVVSRMQHRGTARRRLVRIEGEEALPPPFTPVLAGGREIGVTGTVHGTSGLAILRLDRLADAMDSGEPVTADGTCLSVSLPDGATFPLRPPPAPADAPSL